MKSIKLLFSAIILITSFSNFSISQNCLNFQDTILTQPILTTQSTYTPVWYSKNGITFKSKYKDYLLMSLNSSVLIKSHVAAGYTTENSNYVGNIFIQGNAITKIDFTGITYSNRSIEFDVNYILDSGTVNPYFVNGNGKSTLPSGIIYTITNLTNGKHVKITGNINNIEIHGFEIGIDNLCVNMYSTAKCIDFQDTLIPNRIVPITQLTYTPVWYSNQGITFRSKYKDFTTMGLAGGATIGNYITGGYTTSNSNFSGNIFYQGNLITEINFSSISYSNKKIEFDVNGIVDSSFANPYHINGMSKTSLPAGVTYTVTNLTNGLHITITGNVNTIEFHGFEVAMDNLCVDLNTVLSISKKTKDVFEIYPNPARNFINLKLNKNNFSQVNIIDLTGKLIYNSTNFEEKINVSDFIGGTYIIQVIYSDRVVTKKFIKQ